MEATKIFSVAFIGLLAAISPGPDFVIVARNCISGTFRSGFLTSLGVACALLVHVSYCLLGIAVIIMESVWLFNFLKYFGSAYLLYLGISILKEVSFSSDTVKVSTDAITTDYQSFSSGFLCNLLNPKATLFVLSLFSQFIDPTMGIYQKAILGSIFPLVVFVWFVTLSYFLTHPFLRVHFARFQHIITKIMGFVLCLLSIYVAFIS